MRKSAAFIQGRRLIIFLVVPAAFIIGRRLFEGGVYSSNYGTYLASPNIYSKFCTRKNTQKILIHIIDH